MKIQIALAAVAFLFSVGFGCPSLGMEQDAAEVGFVSLFNGKDLSGWFYGLRDGSENKAGRGYRVENGILFCTAEDGGNLYTEEEFGDFAFRFEFRLEPNSNNGLAIRAPREGNAAYVGMEIQILDDSGSQYGSLRPAQYHGSIYDAVPAKRGYLNPVGEWNSEEIIARGRHITVILNGNTILDADLDEIKDEETLKRHPGLTRTSGHIGFLGHGTRMEFRKIRVKRL